MDIENAAAPEQPTPQQLDELADAGLTAAFDELFGRLAKDTPLLQKMLCVLRYSEKYRTAGLPQNDEDWSTRMNVLAQTSEPEQRRLIQLATFLAELVCWHLAANRPAEEQVKLWKPGDPLPILGGGGRA